MPAPGGTGCGHGSGSGIGVWSVGSGAELPTAPTDREGPDGQAGAPLPWGLESWREVGAWPGPCCPVLVRGQRAGRSRAELVGKHGLFPAFLSRCWTRGPGAAERGWRRCHSLRQEQRRETPPCYTRGSGLVTAAKAGVSPPEPAVGLEVTLRLRHGHQSSPSKRNRLKRRILDPFSRGSSWSTWLCLDEWGAAWKALSSLLLGGGALHCPRRLRSWPRRFLSFRGLIHRR